MILSVFFFAALLVQSTYIPSMVQFQSFIKEHNKSYSSALEFMQRYQIFSDNLKFVEHRNKEMKVFGEHTLGINKFGDLSWIEFKTKYFSTRPINPPSDQETWQAFEEGAKFDVLPQAVDWRERGFVNPVKNQKTCGSCWAFSAAAAIETNSAIKTGNLTSFSEQQFLDCVRRDDGCGGGLMTDAFDFATAHSLCSEEQYPYIAGDEDVCKICQGDIIVDGYISVTPQNETALALAVSRGAVSVAIEADTRDFQFYSQGIFRDPSCGTNLDHGVVVVGFDRDAWIVRNSWGPDWGEDGYIRIARGKDVCGISQMPSFPLIR